MARIADAKAAEQGLAPDRSKTDRPVKATLASVLGMIVRKAIGKLDARTQ